MSLLGYSLFIASELWLYFRSNVMIKVIAFSVAGVGFFAMLAFAYLVSFGYRASRKSDIYPPSKDEAFVDDRDASKIT
ncbi:hypothetical protein [Paraburkholderia sp. GAS33]|uniref:hypothetical protein n=1 Tax=Paraburkholderia sp. GAS33 TaxID=3035130 RepID=UPI003D1A4308